MRRIVLVFLISAGCNAYDRGFKDGIVAERTYAAHLRALGLCERPSVEKCDGGAP